MTSSGPEFSPKRMPFDPTSVGYCDSSPDRTWSKICGKPAVAHIIWFEALDGFQHNFACDEHIGGTRTARWRHDVDRTVCGWPGSHFNPELNVCYFPPSGQHRERLVKAKVLEEV